MALYKEILSEVKRVIEMMAAVEAENLALAEAKDALASGKCLKISYKGTAQIHKKGTEMEFDWINVSGETFGHTEDLETDEFLGLWKGSSGDSLKAFEISSGDKPLIDTTRNRCHSKKLEPKAVKKDITLTFKKGEYLLKNFEYDRSGTTLKEHLQVEDQDATVAIGIDIIVDVETSDCGSLSYLDDGGGDMSEALAAHVEPGDLEQASALIGDLASGVSDLLAGLSEPVHGVYAATERLSESQSADLFFEASSIMANRLEAQLNAKGGVEFGVLPPSVSFGEGRRRVKVSPTVGGSDNPDASVSIGVQIDTNPDNDRRLPVGRFTAGVDVDAQGKVRGGSFGWKCRF